MIPQFEIHAIDPTLLPQIAAFLAERPWVEDLPGAIPSRRSADQWLADLRWRLVDNPAGPGPELGQFLGGREGGVIGVNLCWPQRFRWAERSLRGLCAGSFFVNTEARMQGFFMFRRYLALNGFDFKFATTCNAASGALWRKLGGCFVEHSDLEFLAVFRAGPVAQEWSLRRGGGSLHRWVARTAAAAAGPFVRPRPRASSLTVEPCRDWDRLAQLADSHRNQDALTADRSAAFLRWRYELAPARESMQVYRFRDTQGREGWFSLGEARRGRRSQIRGSTLLDLVWPRAEVRAEEILAAALAVARRRADVFAVRGGLGLELDLRELGLRTRRLASPTACLVGGTPGQTAGLAHAAEFCPADGDTAA